MDYYVNSKTEEKTIYEIYKSCRLCGAGAGYKMPIIQNVINLDPDESELKQKIRDCVQIEVHQDDKMPPLICELCVDKVNDFYEFLEMCKQTNKKTRLRLGLPPQTLPQGAPDAGDCILGVTEPVFINENSTEPIHSKSGKTQKFVKIKQEPEPKVNTKFRKKEDPKTPKLAESKKDNSKITRSAESKSDNFKITRLSESKKDGFKITRLSESKKDVNVKIMRLAESKKDESNSRAAESSSLRSGRSRQPSPPPLTPRGTKRPSEDSVVSSRTQKAKNVETPPPKSILKKVKVEIPDNLEPRSKRPRECTRESIDSLKKDPIKKIKVTLNIPKIKVESKPAPPPPPPPSHKCPKCKNNFKTASALISHMNTHVKIEKVEKPKPQPLPKPEPKQKTQKCTKCDKTFLANIFKVHKCTTKRVPECRTCKRKFQTTAACTNHEKTCKSPTSTTSHKKMPKIPQWLKSGLLPMEVRLMRCDPLCDDSGRCRDASFVDHDYGLDKMREYPYLYNLSMLKHKLRIKSELAMYDRMVKIQDGITDEFDLDECYTHWDSASESDSDTEMFESKSKNDIKPLSTLSLKVLFSPKGLGKVPKKVKKIKLEKPFDSILNSTEQDIDMKYGINNIINSLEDSINENDHTKDFIKDKCKTKDDDTLFGENKGPGVKNSDFDLLFGNAGSGDNLSSNVEKGVSPTLDLSDIDNRLSQTDRNTEVILDGGNSSSVSNTENTDASIEKDSCNKSENESIDRISSSQTSVVANPSTSMTLNKDEINIVTEKGRLESKEDEIQKNGDDQEHLTLNDEKKNCNSAGDTIVEHSTKDQANNKEKSNESTTTINTNHESKIIDYSKRSDSESISNTTLPKDNTAQEEACTEQNKSSINGDTEFPEKCNIDDLEAVSDTDMDDGKLMEAIDAQLGESENNKVTENLSTKVHQESDDFSKDIEY